MSERGMRAAFAFPLTVGPSRLGVLDVFRDVAGAMDEDDFGEALDLAEIATRALLDGQEQAGAGSSPRGLEDAMEPRFAVYQAQGMAMMQLGGTLTEALARLRAHAYVNDRSLGQVAHDILSRTLTLERDER